jgi:hypothetical protein
MLKSKPFAMETSDSAYCIRLVAINLMTAILALSQYSTCGLWNADMIQVSYQDLDEEGPSLVP